jgi:pyruvate/2-oxoglutarate/acetoin dehydrogenase E1 component
VLFRSGPARTPETIPLGTAEMKRRGRGVAFLVFGTLLETVMGVADELDAEFPIEQKGVKGAVYLAPVSKPGEPCCGN